VDAVTSKRQKKMSQQQERQVAKDIGGRTVAGSGAGRTSGGGDVRLRSELRVECKVTEKDYFVLQYADLRKIRDQAIRGGLEMPIFQIRFAIPRSRAFDFAIIPSTSDAIDILTDRKRIKLSLSDLQRRLLCSPHVTIAFDTSLWDLKYWDTFLDELEKASASNQHNH